MRALFSIVSSTYKDIIRKPVYIITVLLFGILIFFSQHFTLFGFAKELNMVREMGIATMALWGFIVIVVFSGQIITQELEDRTAMVILTKPIRRGSFLLGKFFGIFLATVIGIVLLSLVFFLTLWTSSGLPRLDYYEIPRHGSMFQYLWKIFLNWGLLFTIQGFLLCCCQLAVLSAIAAALSAFLPTVLSASALAVIYLVSNISSHILGSIESTSNAALVLLGKMFYYIIPNLGYFNLQTLFGEGGLVSFQYLLLTLLYCIIYCGFILYVACLLFERREIK